MKWLTLFRKTNRVYRIRKYVDEFNLNGFIEFAELIEYLNPPLKISSDRLRNEPFSPVVSRATELIELIELSMEQMKNGGTPAVKPASGKCDNVLEWLDAGEGKHYDLKETVRALTLIAREYQDAIDAYREDRLPSSVLRGVHYPLVCLQQLVIKIAEIEYDMKFDEVA